MAAGAKLLLALRPWLPPCSSGLAVLHLEGSRVHMHNNPACLHVQTHPINTLKTAKATLWGQGAHTKGYSSHRRTDKPGKSPPTLDMSGIQGVV